MTTPLSLTANNLPSPELLYHKISCVPVIVFLIASYTSLFGPEDNIDKEKTKLDLLLFFFSPFPLLSSFPKTIPEPLGPINVQTDVQGP